MATYTLDKRERRPSLRSLEERNRLLEQWSGIPGFVVRIYKKWIKSLSIDPDDAYQTCWTALIRAAELFNPYMDRKFSTYAICACKLTLMGEFERSGRLIRIPPRKFWAETKRQAFAYQAMRIIDIGNQDIGLVCKRSMRRLDKGLNIATPFAYEEYDDLEEKEFWQVVYKGFDKRQREIVRLLFIEGWDGNEIGRKFGISRQRVYQILDKVLTKLRKRTERDWG